MRKRKAPRAPSCSSRHSRPSDTASAEALCAAIQSGFSDAEIVALLACLLRYLDDSTVQRFADSLGESGKTLRTVLAVRQDEKSAGSGRPKFDRPLGPGRAQQDWKKAWADWNTVIDESNDEHGQFVHQDHHWEAPYFWPDGVAEALEPIAKRMRPLIPLLVEADVDPDFSFLESLKDAVDKIASGLEDWIGAWEGDGMCLGPEVTSCLFEAEWAWARKSKGDLGRVVEQIQEFELTNGRAALNANAAVAFLSAVPEDERSLLQVVLARKPDEQCSRWLLAVARHPQPKPRGKSRPDPRRRK